MTAFDDSDLTLLDRIHRADTGLDYCIYNRPDSDLAFLRVDDGHRFVGLDVEWAQLEAAGPSEPFRRLERELTDRRRLDPAAGTSEPTPIMRVGDRVYDERDRSALIAWLCTNGLVPDDVPAWQTVAIDGDTLTLDCFTRDAEGNLRLDESGDDFLVHRVSVPLVEPLPEPRSDLLRRMGEAFDRAVLGREGERAVLAGEPDPRAGGTVLWMPDPPADPEAPTAAELAGAVDLTPYLAPTGARPTFTWVDETRLGQFVDTVPAERSVNDERFRRVGEQVSGAVAFRPVVAGLFAETYRRAAQEESDWVALRAVCTDEAMYGRALDAAREHGWSARQMFEAVACGVYTECGWVLQEGGIDDG